MTMNNKYHSLTNYLLSCAQDSVTLTFSQIEQILGFNLSPSARRNRPNWANSWSQSLAIGWLSARYQVFNVNLKEEIVTFIKSNSEEGIPRHNKEIRKPQQHSKNEIIITNELIEEAHQQVKNTKNYGEEDDLISNCFKRFPSNNNIEIVAMKAALIDVTNTTHVAQHKSKISLVEIAECIVNIKDIDKRIQAGDPEVVNEIAKSNGKINLFSFASKYCCYHNMNLYGKDDYSILDTVVKKSLPNYFGDITERQNQKWQDSFDYKAYNDYVTSKLNELNINVPFRKRKFDHYIWFSNRK